MNSSNLQNQIPTELINGAIQADLMSIIRQLKSPIYTILVFNRFSGQYFHVYRWKKDSSLSHNRANQFVNNCHILYCMK